MTFAAVAALITLTACGEAQPSATAHNLPPVGASGDRLLVVANLPGTDLPVMQQVADGWVQTAPTEGDRVAERALIDADRSGMPDEQDVDNDGDVDQYAAADVWVSESALDAPESFRFVLAPNGTDVWALTPAQYAAHPDLARVAGFLQ